MLSKCLNPQCTAKFRYLGEGRLFRIDFSEVKRRKSAPAGCAPALCTVDESSKANADSNPSTPTAGAPGAPDSPGTPEKERPVEHFWLCTDCASSLTIAVGDGGKVQLIKLPVPQEPVTSEPPGPKLVAAS